MGKFIVRRTNTGVKFDLKAANGEVIASSEVYTTERACRKGIQSVMNNCIGEIEDQTVENYTALKNPKFEIYTDNAGEYRFRLKAKDGQIIAASEGYKKKIQLPERYRKHQEECPGKHGRKRGIRASARRPETCV